MAENKKVTIYIKAEQNVELQTDDVHVSDLGKLQCSDPQVLARVKSPLHTFRDGQPKRQVISLMKVIEEIEKLYPNASVESLGETDTLIERIRVDRHKGSLQTLKLIFVAAISFFGTSFTIMAFHNDIGITDVFTRIHEIVMGAESDGYTNTNELLLPDSEHYYPYATGLKTGFTDEAGCCLAASAEKDGVRLYAILLGGAESAGRFEDARLLFDRGFALAGVLTESAAEEGAS